MIVAIKIENEELQKYLQDQAAAFGVDIDEFLSASIGSIARVGALEERLMRIEMFLSLEVAPKLDENLVNSLAARYHVMNLHADMLDDSERVEALGEQARQKCEKLVYGKELDGGE